MKRRIFKSTENYPPEPLTITVDAEKNAITIHNTSVNAIAIKVVGNKTYGPIVLLVEDTAVINFGEKQVPLKAARKSKNN